MSRAIWLDADQDQGVVDVPWMPGFYVHQGLSGSRAISMAIQSTLPWHLTGLGFADYEDDDPHNFCRIGVVVGLQEYISLAGHLLSRSPYPMAIRVPDLQNCNLEIAGSYRVPEIPPIVRMYWSRSAQKLS